MSDVFVIRNQEGYYATKQREWTDGRDARTVFRTRHKDEAINLVFELSSRDINLRASTLTIELDDRDLPVLEIVAPPLPVIADLLEDADPEMDPDAEPLSRDTVESPEMRGTPTA